MEVLLAFSIFAAFCLKLSDSIGHLGALVQQLVLDTDRVFLEANRIERQQEHYLCSHPAFHALVSGTRQA